MKRSKALKVLQELREDAKGNAGMRGSPMEVPDVLELIDALVPQGCMVAERGEACDVVWVPGSDFMTYKPIEIGARWLPKEE